MREYIAHSQNNAGEAQTLLQHSQGVADLMRSFSLSKEYEDLFVFCGLAHDIGKYSSKFQDYINGCGNGEPHAIWGAFFAVKNKLRNLALPIYGHHIGLPNVGDLNDDIECCEDSKWAELDQAIKEDGFNINIPDNTPFRDLGSVTKQELFLRFLFSALVDADSLDTERHFLPDSFQRRTHMSLDVENLLNCLTIKFSGFKSDTYINKLRTDVRL